MAEKPKRITDIGPPHYEKFLPPVVKDNYGQWKHHEKLAPGVLCHVSESGAKAYTVRAGSPRLLAIQSLRLFADLAAACYEDPHGNTSVHHGATASR